MVWFLFFIAFDQGEPDFMMYPNKFDTMAACFEYSEVIKQAIGSPYENEYQTVCVSKKIDRV